MPPITATPTAAATMMAFAPAIFPISGTPSVATTQRGKCAGGFVAGMFVALIEVDTFTDWLLGAVDCSQRRA
jgi:hypothetical protein